MRKYLLDDSQCVCVAKTRSRNSCAYNKSVIKTGEHALAVRRKYNGTSLVVWVSLGSIDALCDALVSFNPTGHNVGTDVAPSGRIRYGRTGGSTLYCAACEEHMPKGTEGYYFYNTSGNGSYAWLHTGSCTRSFVNATQDVWELAPELLPETL